MRLLWVVGLLALVRADEFAVLVAGSNGFWNYRHQADVCHAYQVLVSHGFDPSNIIVFSYNDVPTDALNPFPNTLYNRPGNAPNVNAGCIKDYTGAAVNTANFLAVLTANVTALKGGNGKVLKSGAGDNVFIYFADHGAPGMLAFPTTYLYADQLMNALNYMYAQQMYSKLVFYMEACESGSMFNGLLPNNTFVFATTSANTNEASWGTYCPPDDSAHGTELYTCLGDLYSVSWMEDSDTSDLSVETLAQQLEVVQARVNQSHPMQFGDAALGGDALGEFQGQGASQAVGSGDDSVYWNARFVKLQFLSNLVDVNPSADNMQALEMETNYRQQTEVNFQHFALYLSPSGSQSLLNDILPVDDYGCLRSAITAYEAYCGLLGEFGLMFVQVLVNACHQFPVSEIQSALEGVCSTPAPATNR